MLSTWEALVVNHGGGYGGIDKRTGKNHYARSLSTFKKQIPKIKQIKAFSNIDYKELDFLSKSFIYCDPPYKGTAPYGKINFDYGNYYDWAQEISKKNFVIFSEYSMPESFIKFKSIQHRKSLKAGDNSTLISDNLYYCEGLFKDWYEQKGGIYNG